MAAEVDITIQQGATWTEQLYWQAPRGTPVDNTSFTAAMQIRQAYGAATALITLTDGNGILLTGADGGVLLSLTPEQTGALSMPGDDGCCGGALSGPQQIGVYDLNLTSPGGVVTRLIAGQVWLSPRVTAP